MNNFEYKDLCLSLKPKRPGTFPPFTAATLLQFKAELLWCDRLFSNYLANPPSKYPLLGARLAKLARAQKHTIYLAIPIHRIDVLEKVIPRAAWSN